MVHLILTGATGLVGSAVLRHIQSLPSTSTITKLTILSRSPVPLAATPPTSNNTTIEVINHTDFLSYPADLTAKLSDAKAIIWAQGVSTTQVSDPTEYTTITKGYPLAAAKALAAATNPDARGGKPFNFVYVSGEGATHRPGFLTQLFARVKGEAELALLDMPKQADHKGGKLAVYCPRPGGIYSPNKQEWDEVVAKKPLSMRLLLRGTLPLFKTVYPSMLIPTPELAKVLVDMALSDGEPYETGHGVGAEGRVLQNVAIRRLAGF